MSTEEQPDSASEQDDTRPVDNEDVAEKDTPGEAGQASADQPVGDLEALRNEVRELTDQVLRARAETENVRRRAARDVENAHKFALEKFAGQLLPVADSLEKAVEAASQAAVAEDEAVTAIAEGVSLSLKLFLDTLAKGGIEAIDPLGHPFDPQLHEAMAMVPNPDAEPNTVIDVMQKGYVLNGRLVRAAMVVVAKATDA
ncbi:MAG: nucleotide exchange factor GrpE [Pseudomonadota bacterium]